MTAQLFFAFLFDQFESMEDSPTPSDSDPGRTLSGSDGRAGGLDRLIQRDNTTHYADELREKLKKLLIFQQLPTDERGNRVDALGNPRFSSQYSR
jgi:hypothetical protein